MEHYHQCHPHRIDRITHRIRSNVIGNGEPNALHFLFHPKTCDTCDVTNKSFFTVRGSAPRQGRSPTSGNSTRFSTHPAKYYNKNIEREPRRCWRDSPSQGYLINRGTPVIYFTRPVPRGQSSRSSGPRSPHSCRPTGRPICTRSCCH